MSFTRFFIALISGGFYGFIFSKVAPVYLNMQFEDPIYWIVLFISAGVIGYFVNPICDYFGVKR